MYLIAGKKKRIIYGFTIIFIIVAGVYLYSRYNPEEYKIFPKCPVYSITGYQCPGCGSQRAFHNLFHGDIKAAFIFNPLMMFLLPYVLSGVYLEYIANKSNPRIFRLRNIFFGKWAALVLGVVILTFTILRNVFVW